MIPRTLESAVKKAMKSFPAILVTGPRQSGKTTLLTERFSKSHRFVSLENPDVRVRVMEDPIEFLKENSPPVILDEIRYTPDLLDRPSQRRKARALLLAFSGRNGGRFAGGSEQPAVSH